VASRKGARREPAKCPHPVVPSRPQLRPSHVLQAERGPKTTIVCSIEVALRKNWYSSTPPFQVTILLTSRFLRPTTDLNSRPAVSGAGPSLYSDAAPLSSILSTKRWIPTPISRRLPNPGLAFTSKIAELAKIKAIRPGQNQPTTTPVLHCTEKGQSRKEDASGLHSKKETRPQKPRALTSVRDSRRHQDVSESGLTAARGCDYTSNARGEPCLPTFLNYRLRGHGSPAPGGRNCCPGPCFTGLGTGLGFAAEGLNARGGQLLGPPVRDSQSPKS